MISIHEVSNPKESNMDSFASEGGRLILNFNALSGTSVWMVNCEPCGCQVKHTLPVSVSFPMRFPFSFTSQI